MASEPASSSANDEQAESKVETDNGEVKSIESVAATPSAEAKNADDDGRTAKKEDDDENGETPSASTAKKGAAGNVSMYAGNRIRHLKKIDGEPFWRKDLQFNMLCLIFQNEKRVFTMKSDGTTDHTFAEIYIDAMANSSKTSQVLKDKLGTDKAAAIDMAIICLLVNVGRMNTTLNFFPEMRARVRTYHSIPCLQVQRGTNVSRQLQDGPRLKSILKGAQDDEVQPRKLEELQVWATPRGNPVNLLFVLSQYAPKISEQHFPPPRDFFDLFTRPTLSSESRAKAFLWLVWWYLESDYSAEAAENNPFGPGLPPSEGAEKNVRIPNLDSITEAQADEENMDTEEEKAFGDAMRKEREHILKTDPPSGRTGKRGGRASAANANDGSRASPYSDSESGGSPAPGGTPRGFTAANNTSSGRMRGAGQDETTPSGTPARTKLGRTASSRKLKEDPSLSLQTNQDSIGTPHSNPYAAATTPQTEGASFQWDRQAGTQAESGRRRPLRSALNTDLLRRQRMDTLLFGQMRDEQKVKRNQVRQRGAVLDSLIKCQALPEGYDSGDDELARRGGLDEIVSMATDVTAQDAAPDAAQDLENMAPFGDAGALAVKLASAFRKVGLELDGVRVPRPHGLRPTRQPVHAPDPSVTRPRPTGGRQSLQQAASPAPSATDSMVAAGKTPATDEGRKKRSYKPRAKRGEGLRNPANRHLLLQQREANKSNAADKRRSLAQASRAEGAGSMKRKRGSLRGDAARAKEDTGSSSSRRGRGSTALDDLWAGGTNADDEDDDDASSQPATKRARGDDASSMVLDDEEHGEYSMHRDGSIDGDEDADEDPGLDDELLGDDPDDEDDAVDNMDEDTGKSRQEIEDEFLSDDETADDRG